MQILFAISFLSFCALLWAAYAVTRHVRKERIRNEPTTPSAAAASSPASATPPARTRRARTNQTDAIERLDWAYFNKDLGNLNDPAAARGRKTQAAEITTRTRTNKA